MPMSDCQNSKTSSPPAEEETKVYSTPEEVTLNTLEEDALDGILIARLRNRAAHTPQALLKEWTIEELRQLTMTEKKVLLALLQNP
jgi:hypothetical protein